jgi:hypothetical protein
MQITVRRAALSGGRCSVAASGKPWTTRRLRVAYCVILLPLLVACGAVTLVFLFTGESAALPLGVATLLGSAAFAFVLFTAPRKFGRGNGNPSRH